MMLGSEEREKKYSRIGGILLFLCIILTVFTPAFRGFIVVVNYDNMRAHFVSTPQIYHLFIISSIFSIGLAVLSFEAGFSLWSRRQYAVGLAKVYFLFGIGWEALLLLIVFAGGFPDEIKGGVVKSMIQSCIGFAIWFSYLSISKRVKATYVKEPEYQFNLKHLCTILVLVWLIRSLVWLSCFIVWLFNRLVILCIGKTAGSIYVRELKSYFTTPIAYVFLVVFLFFSGYLTFKQGFFEIRQADMRSFFMNMPLLFIFLVPATTMRLWAEERKSGSIELLLTLPVTVNQAVLGKFFAAWVFLAISLGLTFPMVITVCYLGEPDVGLILTGYLGSFLMAGGFLAIGCFFSAASKNQVISFVLSVVACAIFVFAGMPTTMNYLSTFLPAGLIGTIESMSFANHFESIQKGAIEFKDLSYFVLLIIGWVAAGSIILQERKAS